MEEQGSLQLLLLLFLAIHTITGLGSRLGTELVKTFVNFWPRRADLLEAELHPDEPWGKITKFHLK